MMSPQTDSDYKKLLSDLIKKQIIILGPTIAISKARSVEGLTISDEGTVTNIAGNPQQAVQQLIEKFMELSGLIVRKTMEPLLSSFPGLAETMTGAVQAQAQSMAGVIPQPAPQAPVAPVAAPTPPQPLTAPVQNPTPVMQSPVPNAQPLATNPQAPTSPASPIPPAAPTQPIPTVTETPKQ